MASPLKLCMVSGSFEYDSEISLKLFERHVRDKYGMETTTVVFSTEDDDQSLSVIDHADVLLLFSRRLNTSGAELERLQKYCAAGRPVVGVRTASHGFQNWLAFDKEVLGGNYNMHFKPGPAVKVEIVPGEAAQHPILEGVGGFTTQGSLYRNEPIAEDTNLLLTGTSVDATEPVAWTRMHEGGRVFYTSLGHQDDFEEGNFLRLLSNGVLWAAGRL
jgi:type 1 glutamine amidotransferase